MPMVKHFHYQFLMCNVITGPIVDMHLLAFFPLHLNRLTIGHVDNIPRMQFLTGMPRKNLVRILDAIIAIVP